MSPAPADLVNALELAGRAASIERDVVLAHGLWVPAVVMTPLAARLAQAGLRCHLFSYHGRERPLDAHAERLAGSPVNW